MKEMIRKLSRKTIKTKSGFTLIEFSMALAVLSVLLIIILQISNNTIAIYQKGLATKAVSTAGRDLLDEFTRAISSSPTNSLEGFCNRINSDTAKNACKKDPAKQLEVVYRKATEKINGQDVPVYGMFCTGKYSYFWNSGYKLKINNDGGDSGQKVIINGKEFPENSKTSPRLLRMEDTQRELCVNNINNNTFSVSQAQKETPVDLLQNSQDLQLAMYDFTIFPVSQNDTISRIFYSGTFVLGTLTGDINITSSSDYCKSENYRASVASDFSYCAINKFNFAAQAIGE